MRLLAICAGLVFAACASARTVEIAPAEAEVVVSADAVSSVRFAAMELTNFLSRAIGSRVPLATKPTVGRKALIVGQNEWSRAAGINPAALGDADAFVIRAEKDRVYLCGTDDAVTDFEAAFANETGTGALVGMRSSLFAVYEFLERYVGCRFYFPGELGEVVPHVKSVKVPLGETRHRPTFLVREYYHPAKVDMGAGTWTGWMKGSELSFQRGLMLNWARLRMGTHAIPCCHGLNRFDYLRRFEKTHPEYFALREDGTRCFSTDGQAAMLCLSSGITNEIYRDVCKCLAAQDPARPRFADIEPADGMVRCHCAACRAKYRDEAPPDGRNSELVWGFTADIGRRLLADGIGGFVTQEAYGSYHRLPDTRLPTNVIAMVSLAGPFAVGDRRQYERDVDDVKSWKARCGNRLKAWTYPCKYCSLCIPGVPTLAPKAWGEYYKRIAPYSCGSFAEAETDRFFFHHLNYYVYSRVAWDASTDVRAVLDEYYRLMYGAAAGEVRQFFDELESVFLSNYAKKIVVDDGGAPYYWAPSIHETWTQVYSRERLRDWRDLLDRGATKLKADSLEMRRFQLMRRELLGTMIDEAVRYHKATKAKTAAERHRAAKPVNDLVGIGGTWSDAVSDPTEKIVSEASLKVEFPQGGGKAVFRLDGSNGDRRLKPSTTYRISCFVKCRDVVRTDWYGGVNFGIQDDGRGKTWPNAQAIAGTHDWFYQEFTYTTPDSVRDAYFELRMLGAHGTAWFDGLRIEEIVTRAHDKVISCEGEYRWHMQGVATDGDSLYWSFTDTLVKTDLNGRRLATAKAPLHLGDLCVVDGVVYVAFNGGAFNEESGAISRVMSFRASDLKALETWDVPEVIHGAGGITFHDGWFYVVGGLPPTHDKNHVYRYGKDFKFDRRIDIASGYTVLGIQTIDHALGRFLIGIYPSESDLSVGMLECPEDFSSVRRVKLPGYVGILVLDGHLYYAGGGTVGGDEKRQIGTLTPTVLK